MTTPSYWKEAQAHLSQQDAQMGALIAQYQGEAMLNYRKPFHTLARAIVGQQISVKAADSVWAKFEVLLGEMRPERYLQQQEEALRACGLSRSKIAYIRNIAEGFTSHQLQPEHWEQMEDEAVIKQLTAIKGIGQWTAEMFLIFHLHRPDILPLGDIGLIKAMQRHYALPETMKEKERLVELAKPWQPYRTVATWYLWRSLDPVPVQY